MDWFRKLYPEGSGGGEGQPTSESMYAAYKVAERLAIDTRERWIEAVDETKAKDQSMEATFILFVALWLTFAWLKHAVMQTVKAKGATSPVKRLWDLLEETFYDGDPEQGMLDMIRKHGNG
jgi:hypothetical protein